MVLRTDVSRKWKEACARELRADRMPYFAEPILKRAFGDTDSVNRPATLDALHDMNLERS